MNKTELIMCVTEETKLNKKDVEKAVNTIFSSIQKALIQNDKVQIIGFGSFELKTHTARKGRNPRTGEPIDISESKIPSFKVGKYPISSIIRSLYLLKCFILSSSLFSI